MLLGWVAQRPPVLRLLEIEHLVPPAPPAGRQVPGKDLEADVALAQDVVEEAPQVGLPRVHVGGSDDDLGHEGRRRARAAGLGNEQALPRFSPDGVDVVEGLAGRRDLEPGPLGDELEASGGQDARVGREEAADAGFVGGPDGDEAAGGQDGGHGDTCQQRAHLGQGRRRGVLVGAAAGGAVGPGGGRRRRGRSGAPCRAASGGVRRWNRRGTWRRGAPPRRPRRLRTAAEPGTGAGGRAPRRRRPDGAGQRGRRRRS